MTTNEKAVWWFGECGGVFCSNCGYFHDDYYTPAPRTCPKCNLMMTDSNEICVNRNYRLSSGCEYLDESIHPDWLLKLRKER